MEPRTSAERIAHDPIEPLYLRIKKDLVRRISAGEWRPGQLLPGETTLAKEYAVSVGTARKAIDELADERLLVRQRGRGTTVTRADEHREPFRFYRLLVGENTRANYTTTYLSATNARANAAEARALNIPRGSAVIRVERLRSHDGAPAVLELIVLREDRCPDGAELIDRTRPGSIYGLLERAFHLMIPRVQEKVGIALAEDRDASLLGVEIGSPLLEVVRHAFAINGETVELRRMRAVPGVHYSTEIGGPQ